MFGFWLLLGLRTASRDASQKLKFFGANAVTITHGSIGLRNAWQRDIVKALAGHMWACRQAVAEPVHAGACSLGAFGNYCRMGSCGFVVLEPVQCFQGCNTKTAEYFLRCSCTGDALVKLRETHFLVLLKQCFRSLE